jgi:hypothetical protein
MDSQLLVRQFTALILFLTLISCAKSVQHDETLAGKRAIEFAQVALVNKDFERGYDLLSDGGKRHLSREKFKETITRMHPRNFPTKVMAIESQPMPGENAIWVYLTGQNSEEQFAYRLTMEASGNGDYKVLTFDTGVVGRMFSPLSEKHPFNPPISTK